MRCNCVEKKKRYCKIGKSLRNTNVGVLHGTDAQAVWKEVHKVYDKDKVVQGVEKLSAMFVSKVL